MDKITCSSYLAYLVDSKWLKNRTNWSTNEVWLAPFQNVFTAQLGQTKIILWKVSINLTYLTSGQIQASSNHTLKQVIISWQTEGQKLKNKIFYRFYQLCPWLILGTNSVISLVQHILVGNGNKIIISNLDFVTLIRFQFCDCFQKNKAYSRKYHPQIHRCQWT